MLEVYSKMIGVLARYRTALGSARETVACLDVATALGYVEGVDEPLASQLNSVQAMLVALVR
jgi:four helix bundle protein